MNEHLWYLDDTNDSSSLYKVLSCTSAFGRERPKFGKLCPRLLSLIPINDPDSALYKIFRWFKSKRPDKNLVKLQFSDFKSDSMFSGLLILHGKNTPFLIFSLK